MKTIRTKVYEFNELSESAKQKAIEQYYEINVQDDWWQSTYEDAENIGLKITEFEIDRISYCNGELISSAKEMADKIKEEHGEICETYKSAVNYLKEREELLHNSPKDPDGDYYADENKVDSDLEELDANFLESICEDYRIILKKEFEYLTSKEAIIETICNNEFYFTIEGKRFNQ
jgi:hypothetical protein